MKESFDVFKEFIKNKNVAVVGIGVSNRPLINFLLDLNAKVTAFDKKNREEIIEYIEEFEKKGVKFILGEDYLKNLKGFDVIFKTPSMRIDSKELLEAKESGAYVTSEMEEFVKYCPAKIYGVTGSDGKTTTTTLVSKMLMEEGYKTWVGGNIGTPLFTKIEEIKKHDKVVLELSSFQLMTMKVSPEIAIITNLSPNHLDIHKGMEEYVDAKKNIFKYQNNKGVLILNKDNSITSSMIGQEKGGLLLFSTKENIDKGGYYKDGGLYVFGKEVCKKDEIIIKGMHNVENYLAAFCAVFEDVSVDNMKKVALTFKGVEHRCEFVRELDKVKYYNDSIASSPSRTLAGLNAFEKPVILIAGGYDKKIPFEPLAEEGYDKIKALVLLGNTKFKIKDAFDKVLKEKEINMTMVLTENLKEAVEEARRLSVEGDIITLSPACASFDMFANFEVRGNEFKNIVNNLA